MIQRTTRGALLRTLRFLLPLDGLFPAGHSLPPDSVILVPTLDCNLKCPYCFQRNNDGVAWHPQQTDKLTFLEWQSVIDELREIGPQVIVLGGELFLYRQALDLLRAVKAADLPLTIITNGIVLPKVASELLSMGLDRLIVSLDGPARVHNAVRGHSRGYELATQGLKEILDKRQKSSQPFVQVSCALTSRTQSYMTTFVEEMGTLGVDRILFNGLIYAIPEQVKAQQQVLADEFRVQHCEANTLVTKEHLAIDTNILRQQRDTVNESRWRDKVFFSPPGMIDHLEAYHAPEVPHFRHQKCTAIYRELWVLPNGDVAACAHINEIKMGNVRQDGVMAIWNSDNFRHFRKQLARGLLPICVRCEKLKYNQPPDSRVS